MGRGRRGIRTARRLFDTGSFFGVGVPEAAVIALLGWFLLGPEELYRLARQVGNWLGELRTFVGQAAKQYETALDDESTRKAIAGIRQTQQTVSEISASWRSVADSFRDPLALGSTLNAAYSKYAKAPATEDAAGTYPATLKSAAPEPVELLDSKEGAEGAVEGESPAELARKRAASQEAAKGLWYSKGAEEMEKKPSTEEFMERLEERLDALELLSLQVDELRTGILRDREGLRELLLRKPPAEEAPRAALEEETREPAALAQALEALPEKVPAGAGGLAS